MNLARELKRKRDQEARLRQSDVAKNIVYTGDGATGGSDYINPSGGMTVATHNLLNHSGLPGVSFFTQPTHDAEDHTGLPGVGNAFVVRQDYADTDTIVIAHALGVRPIVQVIGGAGPAYGVGLFGAGDYGGSMDQAVVAPSSITHNTINQVTVVLSAADTGEVICIG